MNELADRLKVYASDDPLRWPSFPPGAIRALVAYVEASDALPELSERVFSQPHTMGDTARWMEARSRYSAARAALEQALGGEGK